MRSARRLIPQLAGAIVVLVGLLASRALPTQQVLAIWVVLLTAIALFELVARFRETDEPRKNVHRFEDALRARPEPELTAPPFVALERELDLSTATAGHAHRRLLPLLRAAAAARMAARYGVEFEHRPDVARRLLGEETWAFLRPDRPEPENRHARGPRREEIAVVVGRIEAL